MNRDRWTLKLGPFLRLVILLLLLGSGACEDDSQNEIQKQRRILLERQQALDVLVARPLQEKRLPTAVEKQQMLWLDREIRAAKTRIAELHYDLTPSR
jgi:hypothetical protein